MRCRPSLRRPCSPSSPAAPARCRRCIEEAGGEAADHVHIESGHRVDVIGFEGTEDGCRPVVEVENTTEDCNYVYG